MLSTRLCVAVTNYGFEQNADRLRDAFADYFPTILIDASSPVAPSRTDLRIPNTYYPGLWNAAVSHAVSGGFEWVLFIASDVQVHDVDALCHAVMDAIGMPGLGVYTPSLTHDSRCSFEHCLNRASASMRAAGYVEGFFFVARTEVLRGMHPIPASNRFGWGVDVMMCHRADTMGLSVVVDDRVEITHPRRLAEHDIDDAEAARLWSLYLGDRVLAWMSAVGQQVRSAPRAARPVASLDLGCGGLPKDVFGAQERWGVDLLPSDNPRVVAADLAIEPIPFESSRFEYVSAFDFIEHVPRLIYAPDRRLPFVALMNEIHRVLKPGGVFLSVTPAYPDVKAFQDPTHVNIITEETFRSYFCVDRLWARMYGFRGEFGLISQHWDDGKLVTLMRARKPWA